jgi:hypothetical protein
MVAQHAGVEMGGQRLATGFQQGNGSLDDGGLFSSQHDKSFGHRAAAPPARQEAWKENG